MRIIYSTSISIKVCRWKAAYTFVSYVMYGDVSKWLFSRRCSLGRNFLILIQFNIFTIIILYGVLYSCNSQKAADYSLH